MKNILLIVIILSSLISSCTPVRNDLVNSEEPFNPKIESQRLIYEGKLALAGEDYINAVIYFQRAIGFDYYNPEPHVLLSSAYYNLGWYQLASFELDRTVDLLQTPEWRGLIYFMLGMSYRSQGKYETAYGKYKQSYAQGYRSPELLSEMSNLEQKLNLEEERETSEPVQPEEDVKLSSFEKTSKPQEFRQKYFK